MSPMPGWDQEPGLGGAGGASATVLLPGPRICSFFVLARFPKLLNFAFEERQVSKLPRSNNVFFDNFLKSFASSNGGTCTVCIPHLFMHHYVLGDQLALFSLFHVPIIPMFGIPTCGHSPSHAGCGMPTSHRAGSTSNRGGGEPNGLEKHRRHGGRGRK